MSQTVGIAGFGLGFGVVHVLTGPDHLSALATLAANDANAFWLGIQWGIGHSIGLVVVATILLAVSNVAEGKEEEKINVSEELSNVLESCVGIFMILLGIYGVFSAYRKTRDRNDCAVVRNNENMDENMDEGMGDMEGGLDQLELKELNDDCAFVINDENMDKNMNEGMGDMERGLDQLELRELKDGDQPQQHPHIGNNETDCVNSNFLRATIAVCVGIVHGVAGPGGVLGVMPAVQLRHWGLAFLYLGCFCSSATIAMGCFAAGYGKCSSRIGSSRVCHISAFQIELFSAFLSIFVGVVWLTLLHMGILEKVFP